MAELRRCIVCGGEFQPETRVHEICSQACAQAYYAPNSPDLSVEDGLDSAGLRIEGREYGFYEFDEEAFPLLRGVAVNAALPESPCAGHWRRKGHTFLAHAHHELGVICVPGEPSPALWITEGGETRITSTFLHEYAHLIVPGGHTKEFFEVCGRLHKEAGILVDNEAAEHQGTWGIVSSLIGGGIATLYAVDAYEAGGWAFWLPAAFAGACVLALLGSLLLFTNQGKLDHYKDFITESGLDDYD